MTATQPSGPARAPEPEDHPDGEPDPRRWRAFAVCLVAGFMSLLDVSIVNVALVDLRHDARSRMPSGDGSAAARPAA